MLTQLKIRGAVFRPLFLWAKTDSVCGENVCGADKRGAARQGWGPNLQGDVIAILDSNGAVMVNYHYDAYGVLLQTGGTMAATLGTLNPLTYRGYVYDHETGLYYLQSRYYNPIFRQFISPDAFISTGQGFMGYNMFAYLEASRHIGPLAWSFIG